MKFSKVDTIVFAMLAANRYTRPTMNEIYSAIESVMGPARLFSGAPHFSSVHNSLLQLVENGYVHKNTKNVEAVYCLDNSHRNAFHIQRK